MQGIWHALAFGLGVLGEIFLLMRGRFRKSDLWMPAGALALMFCTFYSNRDLQRQMQIDVLLFTFFMLAGIAFSFYAYKRLLPLVDEAVVLLWALVYMYAYFVSFGLEAWSSKLGIFSIIMCLIVAAANFIRRKLPKFMKFVLYIFYMGSILFFLLYKFGVFHEGALSAVVNSKDLTEFGILSFAFSGMVLVYASVSLMTIIRFIPDRHSRHPLGSVGGHVKDLVAKFHDYQSNLITALILIAGVGGLFAANLIYSFMDADFLINAVLVIVPQGLYLYRCSLSDSKCK